MEEADVLYEKKLWDQALQIYKKHNNYKAYYRGGVCRIHLRNNDFDIIQNMVRAFILEPEYLEPIGDMVLYFNSHSKYNLSYLVGSLVRGYNKPNSPKYELIDKYYEYKLQLEIGIAAFYIGKPLECFNTMELLLGTDIPDNVRYLCENNQSFALKDVVMLYERYPRERIAKIMKNTLRTNIVLTVTTCKRLNLFKRTINSFISCCEDFYLIDRWICIDDNSSEEDRKEMQTLYPFFNFVWKSPEQKGHIASLNYMVDYFNSHPEIDYTFHIEDDWTFVKPKAYITDALKILEEDSQIGQVLINRNYTQDINSHNHSIAGGMARQTPSGVKFIEHQYYPSNTQEHFNYVKELGGAPNNVYWPHYSLRPSVTRTEVFKKLGHFDNFYGHFENIYGQYYAGKGYKSVFFTGINCIHTGPKSGEESSIPNSYILNGEQQFNWSAPNPPEIKNFKFVPAKDFISSENIGVVNPTFDELLEASANYKIKILSTSGKTSKYKSKSLVTIYEPNPNFPYKTGIYIRELGESESYYDKVIKGDKSPYIMEKACLECFYDKKFYGASLRLCKSLINSKGEDIDVRLLKNRELILAALRASNLSGECCTYKQPKNLVGVAHDLLCDTTHDAYFINNKSKGVPDLVQNYIKYNDLYPDWEFLFLDDGTVINKQGALKIVQYNILTKDSPTINKLKTYKEIF